MKTAFIGMVITVIAVIAWWVWIVVHPEVSGLAIVVYMGTLGVGVSLSLAAWLSSTAANVSNNLQGPVPKMPQQSCTLYCPHTDSQAQSAPYLSNNLNRPTGSPACQIGDCKNVAWGICSRRGCGLWYCLSHYTHTHRTSSPLGLRRYFRKRISK